MKKFIAGVAGLLLLGFIGCAGAIYATLPRRHQTIVIPGLAGPVSVSFDQDDVARISAANIEDATTALGYVHASERLFQMDLMRRQAAGRLSELVGAKALPIDRIARVLGWERRAEADYPQLPAETRRLLEAYARGVNAYIAARGRFAAPEFLLFGRPEPWRPVDSLLWGKTMQSWLSYNARTELSRLALSNKLSPAQIDQLWPSDSSGGTPQMAFDARLISAAHRLLAALPAFPDPFTLPATASNEWAVVGNRTKSGAPLLAGDPHLDLNYPAIWYLARIDTPDETLAGATAPGLPFLVIGHNRRLAWTFTTTGADTEDVFKESVLPDGRYETPNGPQSFATRHEIIHVRGQPDVDLLVRSSRHGPIISDAMPNMAPVGEVLALQAADLAPHDTAAAGIEALDRAQTIGDAQEAAQLISAPVQNLLVADRAHIALFTTGRVPLRRAGDGRFPVMGADGAHDWIGYAAGLDLPHYQDPASGQLVNGNEPTAPPDFPVYLGRDSYGDWRAQRIKQMLFGRQNLTVSDFARMQFDDTSLLAQELLPRLRAAAPKGDDLDARAAALLAGWNGVMDRNLPQPLIYNAWIQTFYAELLARNNAKDWTGPWGEFTRFVLRTPNSDWCGGNCDDLLRASLHTALQPLARKYGNAPGKWRWGTEHQAQFIHPLLGPLLGPLLEDMPGLKSLAGFSVAVNGDDQTVFRGGSGGGKLTANHGPAYRGVYDLANLDDGSRFSLAPGQSGNIFSSHAGDLLARWNQGDTIILDRTPKQIDRILTLVPR